MPEACTVVLDGETETLIVDVDEVVTVIAAEADLVLSATLVAFTVAVPVPVSGAVYTAVLPEYERLPTPEIDQITPVFVVPETLAVKVCVLPLPDSRVALVGVRDTATVLGDVDCTTVMVAEAEP